MRSILMFSAACLIAAIPASADTVFTDSPPDVFLTVNGQTFNLSSDAVQGTDGQGNPVWNITSLNLSGTGWALTDFDALLDSDPLLSSSGNLTNTTGSSLAFNFMFSQAITPGTYGNPQSSLGATISTGVAGSTQVVVTMTNTVNGSTSTGDDIVSQMCSVTSSGSLDTNTCTFGGSGLFSGSASTMETTLSGMLAVNGSMGLSGIASLTSVTAAPEPGSLMLLGSGLLAAGLIGRKKQTARR